MKRLPPGLSPTRLGAALLVFVLFNPACDGPDTPDGGNDPVDSGSDGGASTCSRDSECGDRSLFCADWRCRPGEPGTDARGCIDIGPPCDGGACDEDGDRCGAPIWCTEGRDGCLAAGDCDGDGEPASECGGGDCDDDDPNRYPGNPEVCDADGRDEDCSPETFGATDADSDTFVDSSCCNGDMCGRDCDDGDVNVNPGAAETCDGLDNDCDGTVDASTGSLCPGGLCVAGRCNLDAWDRSFGSSDLDSVVDVAVDSSGNVLVAGLFNASIDFGGGAEAAPGAGSTNDDAFLASYRPDEGFQWVQTFTQSGDNDVYQVGTDEADGVYLTGRLAELGGSPVSSFLVSYDADGSYRWHLAPANVDFRAVHVTGGPAPASVHVVVAGSLSAPVDLGDGELPAGPFVADYDGASTLRWSAAVPSTRVVRDAAADRVYTAATCTGTINIDGTDRDCGARGLVVARLGATGAVLDANVFSGEGVLRITGIVTGGSRTFVSGQLSGLSSRIVFATGATRFGGITEPRGFVLALDSATLEYAWDQFFDARAEDVAITTSGEVLGVGSFTSDVNFGCATRPFTDGHEMFVARWNASTGSCLDDDVFRSTGSGAFIRAYAVSTGPANSVAIGGNFQGNVDLGDGPIVSTGGSQDGFVMRFGL